MYYMGNSGKPSLECSREIINYSGIQRNERFDKKTFDPAKIIDELYIKSPKIVSLLQNIEELDARDYSKDRKLYKHFIYSSVQKGYGSKIIASAMIAAGYKLILKPEGSNIVIDEDMLKLRDEAKLALLSSTAIWNNPTSPKLTKQILSVYNDREKNIYGDAVRFIIADSGYKEGVDLFDVKYVHIFEDQIAQSDITQAHGRALRYCGQKGLPFQVNEGWGVHIYNYSLYVVKGNEKVPILKLLLDKDKTIGFNSTFEKSITESIKRAAVDSELNKNINEYVNKKPEFGNSLSRYSKIAIGTIFAASGVASTFLGRFYFKKREAKK